MKLFCCYGMINCSHCPKAMQCEGVGMTWVSTLQKFISENLVTDAEFEAVEKRFPNNPPQSKEEYYYRSVFDKYFPNCDKFIHVWKNGCRAGTIEKLVYVVHKKYFSFIFTINYLCTLKGGASWRTEAYTRAGLVDVERLRKGHGLGDQISV